MLAAYKSVKKICLELFLISGIKPIIEPEQSRLENLESFRRSRLSV
jgi:hypothetical protein